MAAAEVQALFSALSQLTEQVKAMADLNIIRETSSGGKKWDQPDKYKMMQLFNGGQKNFEEWSVKFRSIAKAGNEEVGEIDGVHWSGANGRAAHDQQVRRADPRVR